MSNYLTLRSSNAPASMVNMVYSTLTGSSIVGSTIRVSTIVGSTLTMNTSVVGSTLTGSTILATGNVGIGTTAISGERLAIAGTVRQAGTYLIGDAITPVNGLLRMAALSGQTYIQSGLTETNDSKADLSFTSINAATEWMRIRSNGNVGIGTTVPSALLHLKPTGSAMRITGNLSNGSTRPALSQTPGTYEIRGSGIPDDNDDGFLRLSAGAGTTLGTISCIDISGYYTTSEMNSNIRFVTAATERMRIDSGGNVGIGTTNPANTLHIRGSSNQLKITNSGNSSAECTFNVDSSGNLTIFPIELGVAYRSFYPANDNLHNLGILANRWSAVYAVNGAIQTSDSKEKDSQPLPYGINEVLQMRTIKYKWKSQADLPDNDPAKDYEYYGFCADELSPLFPELVYDENKEAPVQMNYSEILPVVVNAIKEEHAMIIQHTTTLASLESIIAAQQSTIVSLLDRVAKLESPTAST